VTTFFKKYSSKIIVIAPAFYKKNKMTFMVLLCGISMMISIDLFFFSSTTVATYSCGYQDPTLTPVKPVND